MAVGMVTAQAQAVGSWHVKNNGTGYTGPIKGLLNGTLTFKDVTRSVLVTCTAGTISGKIPHSAAVGSSPSLATSTLVKLTACKISGTIPVTGSIVLGAFHAVTYAAGLTTGYFGTKGVHGTDKEHIKNTSHCSESASASTVPATFTNANHNFNITAMSKYKITNATSCGRLAKSDKTYLTGKAVITNPAALTMSKS